MNSNSMRKNLREGFKTGVPLALGFIPIAMAFGLVARASGLPWYISLLMSFVVYAGASQFVAVNLLMLGASFGEIVLTTFILNLRHFLMSSALSARMGGEITPKWRALLAFGITDETFSVSALRPEKKLSRHYMFALNTIAFFSWNVGTWLGVFLAPTLPEAIKSSMGIALYVMFIGILVPAVKKSRPALIVALSAAFINSLLYWMPLSHNLSSGWRIIISTIIGSLIGAAFFAKEETV